MTNDKQKAYTHQFGSKYGSLRSAYSPMHFTVSKSDCNEVSCCKNIDQTKRKGNKNRPLVFEINCREHNGAEQPLENSQPTKKRQNMKEKERQEIKMFPTCEHMIHC